MAWTTSVASGDKMWKKQLADNDHTYVVEQARIDRDLVVALAPLDQVQSVAVAAAQAAYSTALTNASTVFRTAEYLAIGNYKQASGSQGSAAVAAIATALPLPWTEYDANLAAAKSDWFINSGRSEILALGSALNASDATYTSSINTLYLAWAASTSTAEKVFAIAEAQGEYAHAANESTERKAYRYQVADAEEPWQISTANVRRAERVARQTAERDFVDNGNATARDAALGAAASAAISGNKQAAGTYTLSEGQAAGSKHQSLVTHAVNHGFAEQSAGSQRAQALANADYLLEVGEAQATELRDTSLSSAQVAYQLDTTNTLAAAIHLLATSHPSPWANYEDAKTAALAQYGTPVGTEDLAMETAIAESIELLAETQALAKRTLALATSVAEDAKIAAYGTIELTRASNEGSAKVVLAASHNLPAWNIGSGLAYESSANSEDAFATIQTRQLFSVRTTPLAKISSTTTTTVTANNISSDDFQTGNDALISHLSGSIALNTQLTSTGPSRQVPTGLNVGENLKQSPTRP